MPGTCPNLRLKKVKNPNLEPRGTWTEIKIAGKACFTAAHTESIGYFQT